MQFQISQTFPIETSVLFNYFVAPELVVQWSAPEGMTLKVPKFEAKQDGRYRYEHSGPDGTYVCEGRFVDFAPNERLITKDTVRGPDGGVILKDLYGRVEFKEVAGGTEVAVFQRGFPDERSSDDSEIGWLQSLRKLGDLLGVGPVQTNEQFQSI